MRNCKFHNKCLQSSLNWLDSEDSNIFFNDTANEQLQMHLGGTHLILFPLLTLQQKQRDKLKITLMADSEWEDFEVLTHMKFGKRIKLKLKADAWLKVEGSSGFKAPLFHFEHKARFSNSRAT